MNSFCIFSALSFLSVLIDSKVARPRGVSLSKASFYQGSDTFHCFDGAESYPFTYVNDDYCDCSDGTDEPGTSACWNGLYHCSNAGFRPMNIPSSRVNDHICDCCDGSDEYTTGIICHNNCRELGTQARALREKERILINEGHKTYQEYCKQGKQARQEKNVRKDELLKQKNGLKEERDTLEAIKTEKEAPEKEAKEAHQKAWEEMKQQKAEQMEERKVQDAFDHLDTNEDNWLTPAEIQVHKEFDIDNNGEVSLEEAKEYLEDQDQVGPELFKESIWPNIKDIFKMKGDVADADSEKMESIINADMEREKDIPPVTPHPHLNRDNDEFDEEEEEGEEPMDVEEEEPEEDEEEDYEDAEPPIPTTHSTDESKDTDESVKMSPYDDFTKQLIEDADQARENFNKVDKQYTDLEKEIQDIQKKLNNDYGSSDEFYPLLGQCFEYTESQYVYKLCPYERASQRSKSGGSETSLGRWGKWVEKDGNKYSAMLLDNGQSCWNGPNRSVKVILHCSVKNELVAASEPNRCEYEFKFLTPSACSTIPVEHKDPEHDEL